jgi:uncharacterized membrane protein
VTACPYARGVASSTVPGATRAIGGTAPIGRGAARRAFLRVPPRQRLPAALAVLTVLSQIGYPLTSGEARDRLTVVTVLLWCAASVTHAAVTRGLRFAGALFAVSAGVGFAAEVLGVATGFPFGSYSYAATLGPRLGGVPLIIPLAWAMMAYPALLVGRRIGAPVLGGAAALASWDLFLDPQMVAAGHWRFTGAGPTVNAIPASNAIGWLAVSLIIMLLLVHLPERARPADDRPDDRLPLGLYLWTYASSVLAAAAFFHETGVAVVGGLVMGIPAALLLRSRPGKARPDVAG